MRKYIRYKEHMHVITRNSDDDFDWRPLIKLQQLIRNVEI